MRNCQVRLNMNCEIYIEESSPVRVLSNVIDVIYQKALEKLDGYQQKYNSTNNITAFLTEETAFQRQIPMQHSCT